MLSIAILCLPVSLSLKLCFIVYAGERWFISYAVRLLKNCYKRMGFYRLTFWIWTFLRFFLFYIWFKITRNSVWNGKTRFSQSQVLLDFSLILLFEVNWLWLQFYQTWSHVIGHWIVLYESSDSQLEGPEGVEPIKPLVESETLGLLWSVSGIENFRNHINNLKDIYNKNLVRVKIPIPKKWIDIEVIMYLFMVPEIFNFTNRQK